MEKDSFKTKVTFYTESDGQTLAYFNRQNMCYAHVGQHSGCVPDYVRKLKKATKEEYNDLLNELNELGYNLIIMNESKLERKITTLLNALPQACIQNNIFVYVKNGVYIIPPDHSYLRFINNNWFNNEN